MESVRCPYRNCQATHAAQAFSVTRCPTCDRPSRARPVRLEATLEARRQKAGDRRVPALQVALVLEDIRSTWNVGSMLRTADGLGVSHVFLCGITAIPPHPDIAATALGAENVVSWSYCPHPFEALEGMTVVSLERTGTAQSIRQATVRPPFCLVVGNEPGGVSPEILACSHQVVQIPMLGHKESLNVAVACGIALFALVDRA